MKYSNYSFVRLKLLVIYCIFQIGIPMGGLHAQPTNSVEDIVPYFIPFDDSNNEIIHEVRDNYLSLEYINEFDSNKEFVVDVYDWKRNKVSSLLLDKTYGLNQYNIELNGLGVSWEYNQLYSCETKNAQNGIARVLFKLIPSKDSAEPYIGIFTNPLSVSCEKEKASFVEYYAQIEGGRSPYKVQWFVLDESRNNLLLQPTEQILSTPGTTSAITVDQPLSYNVILLVEDACGTEKQKAVYLQCNEENPTVNTLFIEPIKRLPLTPNNTN